MSQPQEVVLNNAVLWARQPLERFRGGMRICDGRITRIFHEGQETASNGPAMDLGGMHVIPGLVDAHRHFFVSALLPLHGDASSWLSGEDALAAIREAVSARSIDKGWVFFSGLDHTRWRVPRLPSIRQIDAAAPGVPVLAVDTTFHRGLVSTEALRRAGIRAQDLRVPGDVDTDRHGDPRGTVWEDALSRLLFAMYRQTYGAMSREEKRGIILEEARRCLRKGLTHVHDPGIPFDVQQLLEDAQGHTPLKLSWSVTACESMFAPPGLDDGDHAVHSPHAPMSVKFFLDGAFRTAADMPLAGAVKAALLTGRDCLSRKSLWPLRLLLEQRIVIKGGRIMLPYLRFPNTDDLVARARLFAERGYRLVLHALGNTAARQAAQVIRRLRPAGASVEHLLVMADTDLDDFSGCGAVASIQPGFIPYYAWNIERQGALPFLKAFPLRGLMDRGVPVCISSDGPCAADDPLHNIRRAVDRKKADGTLFDPGEGISEFEALAAATTGAGRSLGIDNPGLVEGSPATFCIVEGYPFRDSSRVVQTWIDGVQA
ncbi:MAG TPA: amidohydrolase family protein [Deltaproteobacteria bacterium]|nr:amidohydrolase family protein [Deltaproteobacteria bacterium]HQI80471.1 amidohydrolase family protein [Deltaproteobacteria bacterium]